MMDKIERNVRQKIDAAGNVISQEMTENTQTISKGESEPDYVKIYTDMWCTLQGVSSRRDRDVLVSLAKGMNYTSMGSTTAVANSQVVCCTGPLRDEICTRLKISQKTFSNILTSLVKAGAIRHTKWPGHYRLNPNFIGKGRWKYNKQLAQGGLQTLRLCWDLDICDAAVADKYVVRQSWDVKVEFSDSGDNPETAGDTGLAPGQTVVAVRGSSRPVPTAGKDALTYEEGQMLEALGCDEVLS